MAGVMLPLCPHLTLRDSSTLHYSTVQCNTMQHSTVTPPPCNPPHPLAIPPPPGGGDRHFDSRSFFRCALLFFVCWCPPSELTPLCIQTQMYAIGAYVWYHSRSKGGPLLATVIGPPPSGPEFLHIQYQGTGVKVVDHMAAKFSWLEAAQDVSPGSPGSPAVDNCASPQPATPQAPILPPPPPLLQSPPPPPTERSLGPESWPRKHGKY